MRRGLVIAGGGAKGAYSFGAMQALESRGYVFEAVSGTSAGSLNAAIWATGDLKAGEELWSRITPESSYRRSWWLKLLPRPMARVLGTLSVALSIVAARMSGSPIDGENDDNVDLAIGCVPALIALPLILYYSWSTWPWYQLVPTALLASLMVAYIPTLFTADSTSDEPELSMAAIMLWLPSAGIASVTLTPLFVHRIAGYGIFDYLIVPRVRTH
jgi:hypothetical protein